MEAIMQFLNECWVWIQNNLVLACILAAAFVFVLIILIVILSLSAKKNKAKKRLKKQEAIAKKAAEEKAAEEAKVKAAEEAKRLEKEKAEQARAATLARLDAERRAAELEEEEKAAAEAKAKAAEKAKTEEKARAEKAAEEKARAEKEAAEKAKAQKEAEEATAKAQKTALYDVMKDAQEEDDVWYDEDEMEKVARYTGKWTIYHILTDDHNPEDEMYFFELHASNGEKLLSSEEYTTYNGALRGIETHKANILKGNLKITLSKKGDYIFKLLSGKNMLLCMGENYPTKARCESAIKSAKRFAKTAVIDENVQDYVIKVPVEDDAPIAPLPDGYNGKWIISSRDGADEDKVYYFELFANNGEKLLTSEEYTTYVGAVNGIQTHKTNIEKGNFRISLTKRGDYIYKLLNGNGQLLCLGEHYKSKRLCQNAVESVRRFAKNSPVLTEQNLAK